MKYLRNSWHKYAFFMFLALKNVKKEQKRKNDAKWGKNMFSGGLHPNASWVFFQTNCWNPTVVIILSMFRVVGSRLRGEFIMAILFHVRTEWRMGGGYICFYLFHVSGENLCFSKFTIMLFSFLQNLKNWEICFLIGAIQAENWSRWK